MVEFSPEYSVISQPRIAVKTLALLDQMVKEDQGARYRGFLKLVLPHISDAYRTDEDGHRTHMGASLLGDNCARAIWYNFHWATKANFEGRMVRLFNRGHIEEGRFIALLLMLGAQVFQQDENGKQFRVSFAEGHAGGSGDGVVVGIPDLPPVTAALSEFKTHSEKSFIELAGDLKLWRAFVADPVHNRFTGQGVRAAKFQHYVQMQVYMRKMELPCALYCAINKNTDDIYMEIVMLDSQIADTYIERGEKLVPMPLPPDKIAKSPGSFACKFCDHNPVCWQKAAPDRNCRTCQYSQPVMKDAQWECTLHKQLLTKEVQLAGCPQYSMARIYG